MARGSFGVVRLAAARPNPEKTLIFENRRIMAVDMPICQTSVFSRVLQHFLRACTRSANSLKFVQLKFLGPETEGSWCPRAGMFHKFALFSRSAPFPTSAPNDKNGPT